MYHVVCSDLFFVTRVCRCAVGLCVIKQNSYALDSATVNGDTGCRCEEDVCPEEVASTCVCSMVVDVRLELDNVEAIHADRRCLHFWQPLKHRMITDLFPCDVQLGEVRSIQLECAMI